jgi:hypothetical protein
MYAFNWVDIYISDVFPFTRNDPALLVFTQKYPIGLYNLPSPRLGKYLVFMPMDDQNPMYLTVREIRVWSHKDLASNGIIKNSSLLNVPRMVGPIDDFCILNPLDANCLS